MANRGRMEAPRYLPASTTKWTAGAQGLPMRTRPEEGRFSLTIAVRLFIGQGWPKYGQAGTVYHSNVGCRIETRRIGNTILTRGHCWNACGLLFSTTRSICSILRDLRNYQYILSYAGSKSSSSAYEGTRRSCFGRIGRGRDWSRPLALTVP